MSSINLAILYLLVGLLWRVSVEAMDKKTKTPRIPRSFTASLVIVITWPIFLTIFLFLLIRKTLK